MSRLNEVEALKPPRTSFSLEGGSPLMTINLCRHTIELLASRAFRETAPCTKGSMKDAFLLRSAASCCSEVDGRLFKS